MPYREHRSKMLLIVYEDRLPVLYDDKILTSAVISQKTSFLAIK